jgi:hypothetical protein
VSALPSIETTLGSAPPEARNALACGDACNAGDSNTPAIENEPAAGADAPASTAPDTATDPPALPFPAPGASGHGSDELDPEPDDTGVDADAGAGDDDAADATGEPPAACVPAA